MIDFAQKDPNSMNSGDGLCDSDCNDCDGVIFGCEIYAARNADTWPVVVIFVLIIVLIVYCKFFM